MSAESIARSIADKLRISVPKHWDGRRSILQMRDEGSRQWKQMEWIGWYFEHICQRSLAGILSMPGPRHGNVGFDGFAEAPWDFKSHAAQSGSKVIVNDQEAIDWAVDEYGWVGLILLSGDATYDDETRAFQQWHSEIKGGRSAYERSRVARGAPSRRRKAAFDVREIMVLRIGADHVREAGSFQESFRNSDGSARRAKMLVDINDVSDSVLEVIRF